MYLHRRVIMESSRCSTVSLILFIVIVSLYSLQCVAGSCGRHNVSGTSNPCINVTSTSCLGTSIKFTHTSLIFANDSSSLSEVAQKLKLWEGLQAAPECWEVIQPYLCSVYLPACDDETKTVVELSSKDLCKRAHDACEIVARFKGWPDFLDCNQWYFKDNCQTQPYESLTFNTSARCNSPLVRTTNEESWYKEVPGCGVQCQNPFYTEEEHDEVHIFVAVFGSLCIACTLFTILTFLIDWKNANRYPALILFFINGCFFLGSIGWMAQFAGDARTDIVCKSDGTVRLNEPKVGSGETASCTVVFIMVYYFLMAGVVWFVMLAYAWHLTFKALGTPRDDLSSKTAYFHIASWCIPLVLTIICLSVSEIDGDSVSGICFVGYNNYGYRAGFVLVPIGIVLIGGMFFLVLGLRTLIKLKKDTPDFISDKATAKIRETILRLGIFALLALIFVLITFSVHVYIFTSEQKWKDNFEDYYFCLANVTVTKIASNASSLSCYMKERPSVVAMEIHIFAFFGAGIAMSSWSWTKASLLSWERFFRKICKKPSNKPVKLKKHKMIAKAFERRKDINNGRLSISFASTHDDPLGMKFDLNSVSSHEMSSNFAQAMPKLVRRRGGMILPTAGTLRRYSDSDIASMASKIASRRQSLDSQLSQAQGQFQESDHEDVGSLEGNKKKRRRRKKKKSKKRNRIQPVLGPIMHHHQSSMLGSRRHHGSKSKRRGSDSSAISRASAHGVELALEKNSMEAVSISSAYSHNNSLEAATLPTPPKTLATNYAIFTASTYMGEVQQAANDSDTDLGEKKKMKRRRPENINNSSQRERAREVTLEMAETHFYQEQTKAGSASSHGSRARQPMDNMHHRNFVGSASSRSSRSTRQGSAQSAGRIEPGLRQPVGSASSRSSRSTRNNSAGSSRVSGMEQRRKRPIGSASTTRSGQSRHSSARSQKSQASQMTLPGSIPGEVTVVQIDENDDDLVSVTSLE